MADMKTRRRGAVLEAAILDAAWAELAAVGYGRLTMEGVAARAGTSKAVLYRRWPNRARLLIAALRRVVTPLVQDVPNTGDLREDLLVLMGRARDHFLVLHEVAPDAVHGFFSEIDALTGERELFRPESVPILLQHAADRGELDLAAIPPRVMRLPLDLNRHEILVTGAPPTDEAITEMVDQIVLPVLRAFAGGGGVEAALRPR
jgi:AcrR family transcriptional regulator